MDWSIFCQYLIPVLKHPLRAIDASHAYFFDKSGLRRVNHPLDGQMTIILPKGTHIAIYLEHPYDIDVTQFMRHVLNPGMTVFDVGANFGYFSLTARSLVGDSGVVVAFEPVPDVHPHLMGNIKPYENVSLEKLAVTDGQEESITLSYFGLANSDITTAYSPRCGDNRLRRIPNPVDINVKTVSLDDHVSSSGHPPDLIKLDIENGEMDALRGGSDLVTSGIAPFIIMEVGDLGRTESNSSNACLSFLAQASYRFYVYDRKKRLILPHSMQDSYQGNSDVLCVPKNREL